MELDTQMHCKYSLIDFVAVGKLNPDKLQKFYQPFQWQEIERVNPQLHYKSPLVSRRLNINSIRYDPHYYQPDDKLSGMTLDMKSKSIVYSDYLAKKQ